MFARADGGDGLRVAGVGVGVVGEHVEAVTLSCVLVGRERSLTALGAWLTAATVTVTVAEEVRPAVSRIV